MRLLIVEDDELLGDGLYHGLLQSGHIVDWVKDGQAALLAQIRQSFDAILLDLGLPKKSGLEVLQIMRSKNIATPVLILTANDSQESCIKGLDMGADDYLVKPFDLDELRARIRALHRRACAITQAIITHGRIKMNTNTRIVQLDDTPLVLSRREFILLQKLLENQGRVLSREQLSGALYNFDADIDSNTLEVHIHNLRKKIKIPLIHTVRGVGYIIENPKEDR